MRLYIGQADLDRMLDEARAAFPEECCGLLVGRRSGDDAHVERTVPAENISTADKTRNYQVDWQTLFDTTRQTRREGEQIVGFYHSHPDGSTRPSTKDTSLAWVDHFYVIIPTGTNRPASPTVWRVPTDGAQFQEQGLALT